MSNFFRSKEGSDAIICQLCQHYCTIKPGKTGICGVNSNENGELKNLVYGHPSAIHVDPIEKKPLYHVLPGSRSFSIGTVGCNFRCPFCQNWEISQTHEIDTSKSWSPQNLAGMATMHGCASVAYTYNEPTIFWPFAKDIALISQAMGLKNVFVTNGLESRETVEDMTGIIDAANVDLKSFKADYYKKTLKGDLEGVKETLVRMKNAGIWVEVTTLVIEGDNDGDDELRGMAEFLVSELGPDVPWHLSAFHPDYKMRETPSTSIETLERAKAIGKAAGLHYIYLGNVLTESSTYCHNCGEKIIDRDGYALHANHITPEGQCPKCATKIPGIWS